MTLAATQKEQPPLARLKNLFLSDQIASLLIDHFDGLDSFEDLPRDGKCVKDMWS